MFKKNFLSAYLSSEDLDNITLEIGRIEKQTSGELRLCIKKKRGYLEKDLSSREIALKEFMSMGMNETNDKTGVLFFILMEERSFEIIADEGINKKVPDDKWKLFSEKLKTDFTEKKYLKGILNMLNSIGEILIKEFPVKAGDKNELPNEVVIKY